MAGASDRGSRTGRLLREDDTSLNEADYWTRKETQFGQLSVVERSPRIEIKSSYGLSNLRDIQSTSGSATITNSNGEYKLSTTASGSDKATLDSAERGQYIPGATAEVGLGVRAPDTPTGDQVMLWGYGDDQNGLFFGVDASGFFVRRRSGGTDDDTRQANFNGDSIPGGSINPENGYVYQIEFAWYGYGTIKWTYFPEDASTRSDKVVLHRQKVDQSVSVEQPNLPVRAEIDNAGTADASDLFVAGRQFSNLGRDRPNERINGEYAQLGSVGTTFLPVVTFQKKASFSDVPVRMRDLDALATGDMRYQIRLNPTLSGSTFGSLTDTSSGETALQVDTSSTSISGGEILDKGLFASGGGNKKDLSSVDLISQDVPEEQPVSLVVRTISGSGETVDATWTLREEW